jgi:hypothetical protein
MIRIVVTALAVLAALLLLAWGALALHFAGPASLTTVLPIAFAGAGVALLVFVRPMRRALLAVVALVAVLLIWWHGLTPRNDRDWQADVANPPTGDLHGDLLTLHNVRNFDYRSDTDFTPRWETRTYDLSKLEGLDMFFSYWGSPAIAHTIMSWDFSDGQHLAISIETRKEVGETYSPVAGFFRQYELYYVAADERDVIRLRTNYRGENVYLYPLRTPRDRVRRALVGYVEAMNKLAATPEFYNAATGNCTTTIRTNMEHIGASMPFDWRYLVNGYLNELFYEHDIVDTSRPLDAFTTASNIDARAKAADQDPDFSRRIREGIVVPLRFDQPGAPPRR